MTLHLVCHPNWMVQELSSATSAQVKHSFGLDVPVYEADDAWWIPQQMAAKFIRSMEAEGLPLPNFTSPGPLWLDSVPEKFLARTVKTMTVKKAMKHARPWAWWKAAEAKIDWFPAAPREKAVFLEAAGKLLPETMVQSANATLFINTEFRFHVLDGEPVTGSAYLQTVPGSRLGHSYYDGLTTNATELSRAADFVRKVLSKVASPHAFTLDVALLASGRFVVLEANPIWCSAWYGSDIDEVARLTIESFSGAGWEWHPDAWHVLKAQEQAMLPVRHAD